VIEGAISASHCVTLWPTSPIVVGRAHELIITPRGLPFARFLKRPPSPLDADDNVVPCVSHAEELGNFDIDLQAVSDVFFECAPNGLCCQQLST